MSNESRRARARRLGRLSWGVLKGDRRLIVFPMISATAGLLLGALSFALAVGILGGTRHHREVAVLGGIIASFPVTFITLFTGVALAGVLGGRLAGESVTTRDGWRLARERIGVIAAWTLFVCTVGALIRLLEERVPLGGKIVAVLADVSWSLATLFAVPVIAYEGLGPVDTLKRSAEIFRARWGEQVGGAAVIDIGFAALSVPAFVVLVAGFSVGGAAGFTLVVIGGALLIAVGAIGQALNQVYRVFLYRSAVGLEPAGGPFGEDELAHPTWPRRGRRGRS